MAIFDMKLTEIDIRDKEMLARLKKRTVAPLREAAFLVEREAKTSMEKGGRVKVGPRGGKKVRIPSPPGTPPHVQSGIGRNSIRSAFIFGLGDTPMTAVVGPTNVAFYMGHIHERGGEFGGRRYPARPFMVPALRRVQGNFPELFREIF